MSRARSLAAVTGAVLAVCLQAGCFVEKVLPPRRDRPQPRLVAMTESYTVNAVAVSPPYFFAGTERGLLRWHLATGRSDWITEQEGLPGREVKTLASDPKGGLWVGTDRGLSHYAGGAFRNLPPPPLPQLTALLPGEDGESVWVGGPAGLARFQFGRWEKQLPGVEVTSLMAGDGPSVIAGTARFGLLVVRPDHVEQLGPATGVELTRVQHVARGSGSDADTWVATGTGPSGSVLAVRTRRRWRSYAVEGPLSWLAVTADGILGFDGRRLARFRLLGEKEQAGQAALKRCPGDAKRSFRLGAPLAPPEPAICPKPQPGGPRLERAVIPTVLPPQVTSLVHAERATWIGTAHLGCARLEGTALRPYQQRDLVPALSGRLYAVQIGQQVLLANGHPWLWRFDGRSFRREEIDPGAGPHVRVIAVLRDARNEVWAIHRRRGEPTLRFSQRVDGRWVAAAARPIDIPSNSVDLLFASFGPDGKLWLGVGYREGDGELRPAGLAVVDEAFVRIRYHRVGGGLLPVLPHTVRGVAFRLVGAGSTPGGGKGRRYETWVATSGGVVRLEGNRVVTFNENDGLRSEVVMDVTVGEHGHVWAASRGGVGRYDGKVWRFPHEGPLAVGSRAIVRDRHGDLWAATDKGAVRIPGAGGETRATRFEVPVWLKGPEALDLVATPEAIWVLARGGLGLIRD